MRHRSFIRHQRSGRVNIGGHLARDRFGGCYRNNRWILFSGFARAGGLSFGTRATATHCEKGQSERTESHPGGGTGLAR